MGSASMSENSQRSAQADGRRRWTLREKIPEKIGAFDRRVVNNFERYGHFLHRVSLGALFVWFGLLKPFGHETVTSLLAQTVYWGDPEVVVPVLGWWEVAIGVCLIFRPLGRLALLLLFIRLPGTLLAFFFLPETCFLQVPFVPTPEGQYLVKDIVILFAAIAIGGTIRYEKIPGHWH